MNRLFSEIPAAAAASYQRAIALYGAYIPAYSRLGGALVEANQPAQANRALAQGHHSGAG